MAGQERDAPQIYGATRRVSSSPTTGASSRERGRVYTFHVSLLAPAGTTIGGSAICSVAFTRDANGNIFTPEREDSSCWYYA